MGTKELLGAHSACLVGAKAFLGAHSALFCGRPIALRVQCEPLVLCNGFIHMHDNDGLDGCLTRNSATHSI